MKITAPFMLPVEREKTIEKLAAKASAPHCGMMGEPPKEKPDTEAVWKSLAPSPTPPLTNSSTPPLVFYLHVPFCIARCAFCGFYRNQTNDEAMENYTRHLLKEIDRVADEDVFTKRPVDIVYFGGGTPTALSADQLRRLISRLHERFSISPQVEFTVEGRIFGFDDERVIDNPGEKQDGAVYDLCIADGQVWGKVVFVFFRPAFGNIPSVLHETAAVPAPVSSLSQWPEMADLGKRRRKRKMEQKGRCILEACIEERRPSGHEQLGGISCGRLWMPQGSATCSRTVPQSGGRRMRRRNALRMASRREESSTIDNAGCGMRFSDVDPYAK